MKETKNRKSANKARLNFASETFFFKFQNFPFHGVFFLFSLLVQDFTDIISWICNTKDGIKNMLLIELYSFSVIQNMAGD